MLLSNAIRQRIINLTISNNIKSLRKLAKKANISRGTLNYFMSGEGKTLYLSTLYNLCLALNVDLVDFFDDHLFNDVIDESEKSAKY